MKEQLKQFFFPTTIQGEHFVKPQIIKNAWRWSFGLWRQIQQLDTTSLNQSRIYASEVTHHLVGK